MARTIFRSAILAIAGTSTLAASASELDPQCVQAYQFVAQKLAASQSGAGSPWHPATPDALAKPLRLGRAEANWVRTAHAALGQGAPCPAPPTSLVRRAWQADGQTPPAAAPPANVRTLCAAFYGKLEQAAGVHGPSPLPVAQAHIQWALALEESVKSGQSTCPPVPASLLEEMGAGAGAK